MAVINLVPLCTGISFGLPADLLHVDRQMLAWFHRWNDELGKLRTPCSNS
ncbi:hypothetical protein PENANT_c110G04200, partial [Penicillium antarcticum]